MGQLQRCLTAALIHSRPAENYHQDYYSKKNRYQARQSPAHAIVVCFVLSSLHIDVLADSTPVPPQFYRAVSGRDAFLERTWGTQFVRREQAAALKSAAALAACRAGRSVSV